MKHNITWKLSLSLVTALLSLQPLAQAADHATPADGAAGGRGAAIRERMQQVASELNLTDEQKAKLKPIFQAQLEKARDLRQNQSLSRREKLAQAKALRQEMEAKLKPVLTAEQFQKWQRQREGMREQIGQRRQSRQK